MANSAPRALQTAGASLYVNLFSATLNTCLCLVLCAGVLEVLLSLFLVSSVVLFLSGDNLSGAGNILF